MNKNKINCIFMIISKQDLILNLKDKKLDLRQKGIHFILYIIFTK
jgi:hypothetical protein